MQQDVSKTHITKKFPENKKLPTGQPNFWRKKWHEPNTFALPA